MLRKTDYEVQLMEHSDRENFLKNEPTLISISSCSIKITNDLVSVGGRLLY